METAVVWLLVLGPLLVGIGAAIYWGSGSKLVGLWAGFVPGAFVLVIAAAMQTQIIISKPPDNPAPDETKFAGLRAYLAFEGAQISYESLTAMFVVRLQIRNSGNSPARDIVTSANGIASIEGIVKGKGGGTAGLFAQHFPQPDIVIGGNVVVVELARTPVSSDLLPRINAITVKVEISGKDVFGIPFNGVISGIAESKGDWRRPQPLSILTAETRHPAYQQKAGQ